MHGRCWDRFQALKDSICRGIFGHGVQDFAGDWAGDVGNDFGWRGDYRGHFGVHPARFGEGKPIKAEFEYKDD